jgi:hypothetical protein
MAAAPAATAAAALAKEAAESFENGEYGEYVRFCDLLESKGLGFLTEKKSANHNII